MRFTLYYRGQLPPNAGPDAKRAIRNELMPQLRDAWEHQPLDKKNWLNPEYEYTAIKDVGAERFSAIVNDKHKAVAELEILFLRPEPIGQLITQGGDIDNRMKTLLDALSIPQEGQLSTKERHDECDGVSHCLLEDDNLISGLRISVDRLLGKSKGNEVLLVINVRVRRMSAALETLNFAA